MAKKFVFVVTQILSMILMVLVAILIFFYIVSLNYNRDAMEQALNLAFLGNPVYALNSCKNLEYYRGLCDTTVISLRIKLGLEVTEEVCNGITMNDYYGPKFLEHNENYVEKMQDVKAKCLTFLAG